MNDMHTGTVQSPGQTRRQFLQTGNAAVLTIIGSSAAATKDSKPEKISRDSFIGTVTGRLPAAEMGLTLPHEHVMCDFIGADKVSRNRYNQEEVIATALPFLREIQQLGVKTFVDCTPAFLGRDPEILACLSKKTGLVILTNTGFYKEPYLPKYTWEVSEERLAEMWAGEILEGIEGTGIKAGFIKIAVNPGPLIPIQKKIVIAACRTHRMTGAAIASHSVSGIAALEQLDILEKEKVDPSAFIFVHAQGEKDMSLHREAARRGAWIEYDGIRDETAREHLDFLIRMLDMGFERQLLISQDSGWYNVGEKDGGKYRSHAFIVRDFLPLMESSGITKETITTITVNNPARAFALHQV